MNRQEKLETLKEILREIVPENSSIIARTDYSQMMIKLTSWERKFLEQ